MISRATLEGHDDSVFAVCFSPDGRRLASVSRDNMAIVWRADGNIEHWLPLTADGVAASFSYDGTLLATGAADGTATVWRADEGKRVAALEGPELDSLAFRPRQFELFIGRADGTVSCWDPHSRKVRGSFALQPRDKRVTSIDFSRDGGMFAVASEAGAVGLIDAETLSPLASLQPQSLDLTVYRCVISPGTTQCALSLHLTVGGSIESAAPDEFEIVFWDPNREPAPDRSRSLVGHIGWIGGLDFSPDGRLLASGAFDESVRVWDPRARRLVAESREHQGAVYGICFSPKAATLASCSADRTVKLWSTVEADLGRDPARPAPDLSLEHMVETMFETQTHGRSSVIVVAQDLVEGLARLDSEVEIQTAVRELLPIASDPATYAIARAVSNTIVLRREQARREGNTASLHRYDALASTVDAALVAAFEAGGNEFDHGGPEA